MKLRSETTLKTPGTADPGRLAGVLTAKAGVTAVFENGNCPSPQKF